MMLILICYYSTNMLLVNKIQSSRPYCSSQHHLYGITAISSITRENCYSSPYIHTIIQICNKPLLAVYSE